MALYVGEGSDSDEGELDGNTKPVKVGGEAAASSPVAAGGRPATAAQKKARQQEMAKRRKQRTAVSGIQQTEKPASPMPRQIKVQSKQESESDDEKPSPVSAPVQAAPVREEEEEEEAPVVASKAEEDRGKGVDEGEKRPKKKAGHHEHHHSHHEEKKGVVPPSNGEDDSDDHKKGEGKTTPVAVPVDKTPEAKKKDPELESSPVAAAAVVVKKEDAEKPKVVPVAAAAPAAAAVPEKQKEEEPKKDTKSQMEKMGMSASFEPATSAAAGAPAPGEDMSSAVVPSNGPGPVLLGTIADIRAFLTKPGPRGGGYVQCKIQRMDKLYPNYFLFLEENNQFLLAARKRKRSASSNYLISTDQADLARDSDSFVGKVRSNFVGTEFVVYDEGTNPKKAGPDRPARRELATIMYGTNILGTNGPRKMAILIPRVGEGGQMVANQPHNAAETLAERFRADRNCSDLVALQNKSPVWNKETQSYVLNFRKRVKLPSVKNFQVVSPSKPDEVLMQFGRVTQYTFALDYAYPLTLLQAFGIALTSFDNKLAVE